MVLCTLARNQLKLTRFSSMGRNWNNLKVFFRAEKTFQQSAVHHGTEFGERQVNRLFRTSQQVKVNLFTTEWQKKVFSLW
jgi:hypothetical protein